MYSEKHDILCPTCESTDPCKCEDTCSSEEYDITCCICGIDISDVYFRKNIHESEFMCYTCKANICTKCNKNKFCLNCEITCNQCLDYIDGKVLNGCKKYPHLNLVLLQQKQKLEIHFEKKLGNKLNDNTLMWICNNCHLYGKKYYSNSITLDNVYFFYLENFLGKYNLNHWQNHNNLPYHKLVEIFIDMGFTEETSIMKAKFIRNLIDEYLGDDNTLGWGHNPSILCWIR